MTAATRPAGPLFRATSIVLVSAWLLLAACWLLVRGRIEGKPVRRWLGSKFRRRYRGALTGIAPEQGNCYTAPLPDRLLSDREDLSALVALEDGVPLAAAGALHDDIRTVGKGRYSHWGPTLYFASSDNSDPRSNGRRYTVEER